MGVDGGNFPNSCSRTLLFLSILHFGGTPGLEDGEGREREVDGNNFPNSCLPTLLFLSILHF